MNGSDIDKTAAYVRSTLGGQSDCHGWWHIHRVWQMAKRLGTEEGADMQVVEYAALLHDIADWKFHGGDETAGPRKAREWLQSLNAPAGTTDHVCDIIATLSFKGAGVQTPMKTLEGKIVQDADRLDAIGAIGIIRAFTYGGSKGREIYDPDQKPQAHQTFEQYKTAKGTTVNHFYEKLLLLKELMNTQTAKGIAAERHQYMEAFLARFYQEWDGKA